MKSQSAHNKWFIALAFSLCLLFCAHLVSKHYSSASQVSISMADEKDAEQKDEVKEVADFFLTPHLSHTNFNSRISLDKPIVRDEHIEYYHYVSPETPPPNC